jgi:hypothetical protein
VGLLCYNKKAFGMRGKQQSKIDKVRMLLKTGIDFFFKNARH